MPEFDVSHAKVSSKIAGMGDKCFARRIVVGENAAVADVWERYEEVTESQTFEPNEGQHTCYPFAVPYEQIERLPVEHRLDDLAPGSEMVYGCRSVTMDVPIPLAHLA